MECSPDGRNAPRLPECDRNDVDAYPTWIVGGSRYVEVMPPERLAGLSRYTPAE